MSFNETELNNPNGLNEKMKLINVALCEVIFSFVNNFIKIY